MSPINRTNKQLQRVRKITDSVRQTPDYAVELAKLEITEQIFERLEKLGLTRADLARRAGVSTPYVTKILRGYTNFTVESLVRLAAALDCRLVASLQPLDAPAKNSRPDQPKPAAPKRNLRPRPALAANK